MCYSVGAPRGRPAFPVLLELAPFPKAASPEAFGNLLESYVPLLIYVLIVLGLVGTVASLSFVLGPSKLTKTKLAPYESCIIPETPAMRRLSVRFYLTPMLLILFVLD